MDFYKPQTLSRILLNSYTTTSMFTNCVPTKVIYVIIVKIKHKRVFLQVISIDIAFSFKLYLFEIQ